MSEDVLTDRYQVIIVGGGPVGVALAITLGMRGVTCALIERHLTPQRIPKGQNLQQRTMEHFYTWGIAEELRAAKVLPSDFPIGGITAYGNLMSDYWFPWSDAPGARSNIQTFFFQKNERLPQYNTEEVLRRRLADFDCVTPYFGWTAQTVEQTEDGVRVTAETEDGDQRAFEGEYVVGCDGGRSTVREQAGIDRLGADYDQRMVLAVFRSRELNEGLKRLPARTTYRVLKPELEGYWQFFGRVDAEEGWFFHAPVPKDVDLSEEEVHRLLEDAAGFPFACAFDHVGYWDLRIAVAQRYRNGRAFIAGDAAHTHPPYGGFGLNAGLEDAVNLGWKLAARLQGWGGEGLLDSYTAERRPIFEETGRDMIASGIEFDRAFLSQFNPAVDREAFESAWKAHEQAAASRAQTYCPHYEGSQVVFGPAGAVSSIHGEYAFKARPGHHLAPLPLSSGRNVFEELGSGFTLVALTDASTEALEVAARTAGVPLKVIRDSFNDGREAYEARLILVRPDQYVAWVGDEMPEDAAEVLSKVTGR